MSVNRCQHRVCDLPSRADTETLFEPPSISPLLLSFLHPCSVPVHQSLMERAVGVAVAHDRSDYRGSLQKLGTPVSHRTNWVYFRLPHNSETKFKMLSVLVLMCSYSSLLGLSGCLSLKFIEYSTNQGDCLNSPHSLTTASTRVAVIPK